MTNASFNLMADEVLQIMCELAEQAGVTGVAVLANLEDANDNNWVSRMKVCGATVLSRDGESFNLIAVAHSKIAEMMETKLDSGSNLRPLLVGELGYQGGAILTDDFGYIAASFSGGPSEVDYSISLRGLKFMQAII